MSRTDRFDTLRAGIEISCASHSSTGTLGAIVRDNDTWRAAILTNRHVVAENAQEVGMNVDLIMKRAKGGKLPAFCSEQTFKAWEEDFNKTGKFKSPVFQAGFKGGTNPAARLVAFVGRCSGLSDAALCPLIDGVDYACDAVGSPYYLIPGAAAPQEGLLVMKSGKATGVTYGRIKQISGSTLLIDRIDPSTPIWPVQVYNSDGSQTAVLASSGLLSDHGDSGSVWVSADPAYFPLHAVGLLHKGHGSGISIANDINDIMAKLRFSFVPVLDILD